MSPPGRGTAEKNEMAGSPSTQLLGYCLTSLAVGFEGRGAADSRPVFGTYPIMMPSCHRSCLKTRASSGNWTKRSLCPSHQYWMQPSVLTTMALGCLPGLNRLVAGRRLSWVE